MKSLNFKVYIVMEKAGEKIERNTLGLEEQGVVHRSFQHEPYFSIEHEFSKTAFIEARESSRSPFFSAVSEKHMETKKLLLRY